MVMERLQCRKETVFVQLTLMLGNQLLSWSNLMNLLKLSPKHLPKKLPKLKHLLKLLQNLKHLHNQALNLKHHLKTPRYLSNSLLQMPATTAPSHQQLKNLQNREKRTSKSMQLPPLQTLPFKQMNHLAMVPFQ